jgi:hypothetical protein
MGASSSSGVPLPSKSPTGTLKSANVPRELWLQSDQRD